jgi:hypothetical protein
MTRLSRILLIVLLAGACAVARVGTEPDGGPPDGSGALASDAGLADGGDVCAVLLATVSGLISSPQTCRTTADCARTGTACGLPGVCGALVNAATATSLIQPVDAWIAAGCEIPEAGFCPNCPAWTELALCRGGLCVAEPGAGEPCQTADDCPSTLEDGGVAQCLTDGPFSGGYCVQQCVGGSGCPVYNLSCRTFPSDSSSAACFLACGNDSQCRVDAGYRCCPDWNDGGFAAPGNVCYPGPCPTP